MSESILHFKVQKEEERQKDKSEYVEWWGQEPTGQVWHSVMYRERFVVQPRPLDYPAIPYVLTSFKQIDDDESLPFLYPILWSMNTEEYLTSRALRLTDMYANLPPVYRGNRSIELEGTWGKVAHLAPDEKLEFPVWPGNPPDIYRFIEDMRRAQAQGTFSEAMFGEVSGRMSGYGLSQILGADTIRSDTPRSNLELAYSAAAELMFGLMQRYSPETHLSVVAQIKNRKLTAMLSGNETRALIVETYIKPKQTQDEARLAALGAQLASLPNPPVSVAYILEHYFGINQPEDEINRRMSEEVMKDPLVRMMTIIEVLKENNSPYVAMFEQQLQQAIAKSTGGAEQPQPEGIPAMGMGLPQAVMGNPPIVPPSGNVVEENGPTMETMMYGGPRPEELI